MRKTIGLRWYLSNECLVFLHQLIQVLLVLLHPLQEVHLLMMQQSKLLIYLEDEVRQLQTAVWVQDGPTVGFEPATFMILQCPFYNTLTKLFCRQMFSSSI